MSILDFILESLVLNEESLSEEQRLADLYNAYTANKVITFNYIISKVSFSYLGGKPLQRNEMGFEYNL
jgi:hypothetical protein